MLLSRQVSSSQDFSNSKINKKNKISSSYYDGNQTTTSNGMFSITPVAVKEAMILNSNQHFADGKGIDFGSSSPRQIEHAGGAGASNDEDESCELDRTSGGGAVALECSNPEETITDEHFLENDFSLPDELHYKQLAVYKQ